MPRFSFCSNKQKINQPVFGRLTGTTFSKHYEEVIYVCGSVLNDSSIIRTEGSYGKSWYACPVANC